MRVVQEKKINEEYHKVQMLTTVAMPTPYISASLSHTAYINNVVSLVRLLTEGAAWKDKAGKCLNCDAKNYGLYKSLPQN